MQKFIIMHSNNKEKEEERGEGEKKIYFSRFIWDVS